MGNGGICSKYIVVFMKLSKNTIKMHFNEEKKELWLVPIHTLWMLFDLAQ